ncbi:hypothetical protein DFH06DRAFT_1396037 [Mycena polygramma]|nr:hypothetical protein DFH06DRAFT_1396037 [Mycena polygramma]
MDSTPSRALVRTFDMTNPLLMLESILGDPVVRALYRLVLGPAAQLMSPPSLNDIVPHLDHGHGYCLRPVLSYQYRRIFDTIAAIILCAANDYSPWTTGSASHVSAGVPWRNLIEIARVPAICLFRGYPYRTFEDLWFETMAEALEHCATLQQVHRYFLFWIANGVRSSIENGLFSSWNWAAPLGMSKIEFIHRVTPTFYYGGYSDLAVHMRDRAEQSIVDFVRLVSGTASQLVFTEREVAGERICYVAAWPVTADQTLAVTSAAPVDQVLRQSLTDDGVADINGHLRQLALDSEEESMEIEPYVI